MRNLSFMTAMKLGAICAAAALCGCGVFQPRDVEAPRQSDLSDALNLADILAYTTEVFTRLDYEDLFSSDMIYVDNKGFQYDKQRLLSRINTIKQKHRILRVSWEWKEQVNEYFDKSAVNLLFPHTYRVRADSIITIDTLFVDSVAVVDTVYQIDYTGVADFKLKYDANIRSWTICYWKDVPDGLENKSFFHPEFE